MLLQLGDLQRNSAVIVWGNHLRYEGFNLQNYLPIVSTASCLYRISFDAPLSSTPRLTLMGFSKIARFLVGQFCSKKNKRFGNSTQCCRFTFELKVN